MLCEDGEFSNIFCFDFFCLCHNSSNEVKAEAKNTKNSNLNRLSPSFPIIFRILTKLQGLNINPR